MLKGFKTRLNFTKEQEVLASKHAGIARSAYNWGLEQCEKSFKETKKTPSSITLHKQLVKDVKSEKSYYYESSKWSPQKALMDLETAYKNFHRIQKKYDYKKYKDIKKHGVVIGKRLEGLPQFKK